MKTSVGDDIPYTDQALKQDLLRVRNAWDESQARRERDAIYGYLSAVFGLVAWWAAEHCAIERAREALRLRRLIPSDHDEPFAAIICCTADPSQGRQAHSVQMVTRPTLCASIQGSIRTLERFMKRKGGINECAARCARH